MCVAIYSNNHIKLNTRNERSRYVENFPCVCFFHAIKIKTSFSEVCSMQSYIPHRRCVYEEAGLTDSQIDKLLVLDVKEHSYFTAGGISVEHGGGILFAQDENIMGWLFLQAK